jgi:hypothetical protein
MFRGDRVTGTVPNLSRCYSISTRPSVDGGERPARRTRDRHRLPALPGEGSPAQGGVRATLEHLAARALTAGTGDAPPTWFRDFFTDVATTSAEKLILADRERCQQHSVHVVPRTEDLAGSANA